MIGYRQMIGACVIVLVTSACAVTAADATPADSGTTRHSVHGTPAPTGDPVHGRPAPMGTLEGKLVVMGGPAPGSARPADGLVSILSGGDPVTVVEVSGGTFTQQLPPGRYTLTAEHGGAPCTPADVTITEGGTATAEVICHVP
ncbi:hypothetical protein ACGFNP_45595 [Nonomuraea sp. NPDC049269]|uniref:hypothetical protein n=1 Tax=Nonomuraea sp. NPDC049269 TaxID=3364349 RepID=UPI00371D13B1